MRRTFPILKSDMRQLWIVNHYAQSPQGVGAVRHFSLAKYLNEYGWRTCIIASSVQLNTGRQGLDPGEDYRTEEYENVEFRWVRSPEYRGRGMGRIWNMIHFAGQVQRAGATCGIATPDVVIGSTVHPLAAWAGLRLALRHRVPFIFEIRDLWPETLIAMGHTSRHSPQTFMLRQLERRLCRKARAIITLLPRAADYLAGHGVRQKTTWIPNGVDLSQVESSPLPDMGNNFRIAYLGAHGQANDLETLIKAMCRLRKENANSTIECHLVGAGPVKSALMEKAEKLGLNNVKFHQPVPQNELYRQVKEYDAFINCTKALPELYKYGVSMNKLFDYMAMSRPTIVAMDAVNNPIKEAQAGLTVPPEDPAALAEAILKLSATPLEQRQLMANRARSHVAAQYDYKILAGRLFDVIDGARKDRSLEAKP